MSRRLSVPVNRMIDSSTVNDEERTGLMVSPIDVDDREAKESSPLNPVSSSTRPASPQALSPTVPTPTSPPEPSAWLKYAAFFSLVGI